MDDELSVADAAKYLGISKEAAHKAVRENRLPALAGTDPVRLSLAAVEEFHRLRQASLVASLARSGETPVSVARRVREALFRNGTGVPRSMTARLAAMPIDWRQLFSKSELAAAGVRDGGGCRWCRALEFAAFLGQRPVEYSEAYAELFGGQPCSVCAPGLLQPFMAALAARVHPEGVRPSAARTAPTAAEREAAAEWASQRARAAVARPVQDDDGRALVNRRLQQTRARLKDAKRTGDQRSAIRLQQTLQSLTADARAVDGRSAATARPGVLRCGHALAAGCACPRRAPGRGRS